MRLPVPNSTSITPGTRVLAGVCSFVLHVYELRGDCLYLLVVAAVLGQDSIVMVLRMQVVDRTSVTHLAVHLRPTHELLLLSLASCSCLVICQRAQRLGWDSDYVTAASRATLVVLVDYCFALLELLLWNYLVALQVSLVLLLAILLAVVSIALVLHGQFVEVLTLAV